MQPGRSPGSIWLSAMQFTGGKKPAVGILYDTDFGGRIDSILALAMLHGLETKQESRIASITISNPDLEAAQLCDVVEKFYLNPNPVIGLLESGVAKRGLCRAVLATLETKPGIRSLTDTAPPELLLRNALTAQYDGNAAIVSCGPSINLQRLLAMPGAPELVKAKVRMLVTAGQPPKNWPTPVVQVSEETGMAVPYPAESIERDFSYAPAHPVAAAYRAFRTMPYDASSTAMAAVLYAVRPALMAEPLRKEAIVEAYTQLASAKPQARFRRFPVADENKVLQ